MQIRSFRLSDYRSVATLLKVVLSEECCAETMDAFARQLSWDSELILVATVHGNVVGVLIGTIDEYRGYVYRIAVHPDYQRQGIGKALVQAMHDRFRERRVLKVIIAKDKHNELLWPFYQALGATTVDFAMPPRPLAIVAG
jgi:ribosomal protein S18 acetylase RimI-like enzyme